MRLWRGWGEGGGGVWGWVWCFLPLSDDGGVFLIFTASFYHNVCMSRLSLGDNTGVTSSFLTPATEPNAGIYRQVLALHHCPVHQVLTGSEERSTESSLEHIPLSRERCYFFFFVQVDVPANYSAWSRTTGFNFSVGNALNLSVFTCDKPQIFSPLPCLYSHLSFLQECTPLNVNSLQKDLYVYPKKRVFIRYTKYIDEYIYKSI